MRAIQRITQTLIMVHSWIIFDLCSLTLSIFYHLIPPPFAFTQHIMHLWHNFCSLAFLHKKQCRWSSSSSCMTLSRCKLLLLSWWMLKLSVQATSNVPNIKSKPKYTKFAIPWKILKQDYIFNYYSVICN